MSPSAFAFRVYEWVRRIPRGYVTTYGALSREIGCGSAQAVGQALKRNPYAPSVPCHRVIASDLTPGGFQGESGGARVVAKIALLAEEGVLFKEGRLADPACLFQFGVKASGRRSTRRP